MFKLFKRLTSYSNPIKKANSFETKQTKSRLGSDSECLLTSAIYSQKNSWRKAQWNGASKEERAFGPGGVGVAQSAKCLPYKQKRTLVKASSPHSMKDGH